jgi:hypothetical protein
VNALTLGTILHSHQQSDKSRLISRLEGLRWCRSSSSVWLSMPTPTHAKTLLVITTVTPVFARLFDRDALLHEARRLGAVKRDRFL